MVCGGTSAERRISLRSGGAVLRALRKRGLSVRAMDPKDRSAFFRAARKVDVLFMALHGNGGEDGTIQEKLERLGIPFTGSPSAACRKSFNKQISKRYFERLGVPTPPYQVVRARNWRLKATSFPVPFFVKPLDGGSSQGVFLVEDFRKSAEKIRRSVVRHKTLLLEQKIHGRELTAGLLVGRALPVVEVRPSRPFYDFKAKYTAGMTIYEVPAKLPPRVRKRVQQIAVRVYRGLGLCGFARVDLMLDKANRPYVLEVNSIPGLTEFSLLPKAARAAGVGFDELCMRLLRDALARKK